MSQIVTRIHIVVKDKEDWKKLHDMDWLEDYGLLASAEELFGGCDKHFVCDAWACDDIESFLYDVIDCLPDACLIISDETDLNVEPYTSTLYYAGGESLGRGYFGEGDLCEMFHRTDINDVKGWFDYGKFALSEEEADYIASFL